MKTTVLALLAAFTTLAAASARADILTSGGTSFRTGTPTPTLTFSAPITLTITTTGNIRDLIFDEWVTSDGSNTQVLPSFAGESLSYSLAGTPSTIGIGGLIDNLNATAGAITPNDGYLFLGGNIAVTAGQTLTINAGSYTFGSNGAFNPNLPTDFTGSVFATDPNGNQLTNSVRAVPEPGTWAVFITGGVFLLAIAFRRRRA